MLIAVFWAALFLVVYTYLIYPVLLWLLAAGRKMPEYAPLGEWPDRVADHCRAQRRSRIARQARKRAGHGLPG